MVTLDLAVDQEVVEVMVVVAGVVLDHSGRLTATPMLKERSSSSWSLLDLLERLTRWIGLHVEPP